MKIHLTFDTDWVHESVIEYVVELLDNFGVQGTFFATNSYDCLLDSNLKHEVGIHPNFNKILNGGGGSIQEVIDSMLEIYPESKGFRSHSLTQSSSILAHCYNRGIIYDSNLYHPNGAEPYLDYSGLLRLTHNYVDLGHLIENKELSLSNIPLLHRGINILDFHPIHIYLNTQNVQFYESRKHMTKSRDLLMKNRNTDLLGVGDLFIDLLMFIKNKNLSTNTLFKIIKNEKK